MADKGVFRRYIEIVLDKASANKAKKDTQDALNAATDSKKSVSNFDTIARAATNVTRVFAQAAAAVVGYALAITKLTERGGQVLNVQRVFSNVVGDSEAAITKLRKATDGLISDYDLMVGFNKAFAMGAVQTIDQFGEMSKIAQQLGRALGVDAAFAMESLTLGVSRGSRLILDNLGIVVKGAVTVESAMAAARETIDKLGGSSTTTADMLARVVVQFGNLRDEVGKFLAQSDTLKIAFFETGNILETLILSIQSKDLETAKQAFKSLGSILGSVFAGAFADALKPVFEALTFKNNALLPGLIGATAGVVAGIPLGPGGMIAGGIAGAAAPEIVGRTLAKEMDVLSKAAWSNVDAQVAALGALNGQLTATQKLNALMNPPGAGTAGTGPRALPTFDTSRTGIAGPTLEAMGGGVQFPAELMLSDRTEQWLALVDIYRDGFSQIESAGQTAALGIQSAFQDAFSALGDEGNAFGNFFEALFRGTAAAALTSIAQLATSKVVENIANAFENSAKASAALAMGNPFTAALFSAAAKGHVMAAAKWGLVGGVAGAAAAAVSGGGGGGSFRGSDVVGRQIDKLDASQGVVNVYIDGVDPMNPRHQRLLWGTVARGQQRAGPNARVNILPRGNA